MKYITRSVWILSLISLFTDTASEMLYPIMPFYLKSIGFSIVLIGIFEGVAEATAGLSKGYFGKLSDVSGKRVPFVQIGYALSMISKPMMALFGYPIWIFFARTLDRFGKGIRTGARDAILSSEAKPETKGKVFGFHRSMDTLGAAIGPFFALLYLYYYPEDYRTLFIIAVIPGLLAVLCSLFLKEKTKLVIQENQKLQIGNFFNYFKFGPPMYRKIVFGLLVFTLFNSSDVFLLLKAKDSGLSDLELIGVYIFYNLVYAVFAFPLGILADKIGLRIMLVAGLFLFSIVYFAMSLNQNLYIIIGLFFLYGLYAAATEGIAKAWISNVVGKADVGTAIGTYSGLQSISLMGASSLAGLIWFQFGANVTFLVTSGVAFFVALYFLFFVSHSLAETKEYPL